MSKILASSANARQKFWHIPLPSDFAKLQREMTKFKGCIEKVDYDD